MHFKPVLLQEAGMWGLNCPIWWRASDLTQLELRERAEGEIKRKLSHKSQRKPTVRIILHPFKPI